MDKLNSMLKKLRIDEGYSLDKISSLIPVSKQGYHLWEQGLRTWKLEVLAKLSAILGFRIIISKGNIHIEEDKPYNINYEEEITMAKKTIETRPEFSSKREFVDIGLDMGVYSIIKVYTSSDNVEWAFNSDIMDPVLVYTSREEAEYVFGSTGVIPIYALYNTETDNIYERTYCKDFLKPLTFYFVSYAPILDGVDMVYIDTYRDFKISKKYITIDLDNYITLDEGHRYVTGVYTESAEDRLVSFAVTDISGAPIAQINHIHTKFPYELIVDKANI